MREGTRWPALQRDADGLARWIRCVTVSEASLPKSGSERNATTSQPRRRRPSPSSEKLLRSVYEIFLDLGFERANFDLIAASAGVAKRTLYMRYGDKETLFKAAFEHAIERWIVPVERLREAECGDLEGSLIRIGDILIGRVLDPEGLKLLQLTNSISARMPEVGAWSVRRGIEPAMDFLADFLNRRLGPDFRYYPNAQSAAFAFLNLVVSGPSSMVAWGVLLDRQLIQNYVRSSVGHFLNGLLPAPETASTALAQENQRLKTILADTMLELDGTRRELAQARKNPADT